MKSQNKNQSEVVRVGLLGLAMLAPVLQRFWRPTEK